jgi:hypothetical protein
MYKVGDLCWEVSYIRRGGGGVNWKGGGTNWKGVLQMYFDLWNIMQQEVYHSHIL